MMNGPPSLEDLWAAYMTKGQGQPPQGGASPNIPDPYKALLSNPSVAAQMSQLGLMGDQDEAMQQQMSMGNQLRNRAPQQGYGAFGGLTAGLTNAATGIRGSHEIQDARDLIEKNANDKKPIFEAIMKQLALQNGE